jgi:hypothetical protein
MSTHPQGRPQDSFTQAVQDDDGSHPESWIPEVGDSLIGTIERYDSAATVYGERDIVVVRDEASGELRGFWLLHDVAISEFARQSPKPGERVGIKRLPDGQRQNPQGGRASKYKRYLVRVDRQADPTAVPDFQRHLPPDQRTTMPDVVDLPKPASPFEPQSDGLPF